MLSDSAFIGTDIKYWCDDAFSAKSNWLSAASVWCAGSVQSSNEMQSDIIAFSSIFFCFFLTFRMWGENICKFQKGVIKRERLCIYLLHDFTHIQLWPLFLVSSLLVSSPSGVWKQRLSCWFLRVSGCSEVADDNCCLSLWMAAGVPSMRGAQLGMRPGTLNCSQSQTYSGWNCFTLSFLRCIFLHTWIIAGCQRCRLT